MERVEKEPEMAELGPTWWISHGTKMRINKTKGTLNSVVIEGSAAEVIITRAPGKGWFVDYKIKHGEYCQSDGRVWMNDSELAAAFGLKDDVERLSDWMIERFGGTVAKQRKFLRYKEFLNIPAPGSGYQGDPNVSLKLYPETISAVKDLLSPTNQQTSLQAT